MDRTILHINVVSFYVAVARALSPRLAGRPAAVASAGAGRRVVIDASSDAYAAGIYKGMLLETASRRCPDLAVLDPTPDLYDRACRAMMDAAARLSPRVEPAGPGHLFIDLTGTERLFGAPVDTAEKVRRALKTNVSLDSTVGLAVNKLVSKVATRIVKPIGLCRIMRGCEDQFLSPLSVGMLPGIDGNDIRKLLQFNIRIVRDLHAISVGKLSEALGDAAAGIYRSSHGIDESPVREIERPAPSVREAAVLPGQTNDDRAIEDVLFRLVANAGFALRNMNLAASRMRLCITYADGARAQRSVAFVAPRNGDPGLFEAARALVRSACARRVRLTSMALELPELTYPYGQLDLFGTYERENNLMEALDSVKKNFGRKAIGYVRELKRD